MRIRTISFDIYKLLIFALMFDAYAFVYIGSYPVTLFTLFSCVYIIDCLIRKKISILVINSQNIILLLLILNLCANYVLHGFAHTTSFLQALYFMILALAAYRIETKQHFKECCSLFQKLMMVMAIYGIYQFAGRIIGLPLSDLIIKNHMVTGYNWTNPIYVFGMSVYRSNAVFREPSYFGQMLAISLLLYVPDLITDESKLRRIIIPVLLQGVALVLTFSGTGFFMLGIAGMLYLILANKTKKSCKRIICYMTFLVVIALSVIFFTPLGNYFLGRLNEMSSYNQNAASGFVRFKAWIYVVKEALNQNLWIGSGIGTGAGYIAKYSVKYYAMTLNGFARVATELGVLGVCLWLISLGTFLMNKGNQMVSSKYLILICAMCAMIFMNEAFSSNIFWAFIMLLNCRLEKIKGELV